MANGFQNGPAHLIALSGSKLGLSHTMCMAIYLTLCSQAHWVRPLERQSRHTALLILLTSKYGVPTSQRSQAMLH